VIPQETIDQILMAARIEEVVGDFVQLRKRGVNMLGLCPFHNEKTPSFTVSPAKNIYKCFGCSKGGDPVSFIREHEHYSYPDALRYLARKYGITVAEQEASPEEEAYRNEKEGLYVVSSFAQQYFSRVMSESEEGKAIGLSYFKERGFTDEIITKFQLGYSQDAWDGLLGEATTKGYSREMLEKSGLVIVSDDKCYDRFRGRVMFPIHNVGGRVIGFGGRVLKSADKSAKYVNTPETDIYHKSKVLYGLHLARKAMIAADECYLVEGYTDVVSMHQTGIENVVASSGTALTQDQVRLISRFTKNITVLFDGDQAGIKASIRGIDIILGEGMNVRVVLFPNGEDPDSFSRREGPVATLDYLKSNVKDFVVFKTSLLLDETGKDPIKRVTLIKDVVSTIALIPDPMMASAYIKECSVLMNMSEQVLFGEYNKVRKSAVRESAPSELPKNIVAETETDPELSQQILDESSEHQERDIIRLLLNFGNEKLYYADDTDPRNLVEIAVDTSRVIYDMLSHDEIMFRNPVYQIIMDEVSRCLMMNEPVLNVVFTGHHNPDVRKTSIDLLTDRHELSEKWQSVHGIYVPQEKEVLKESVTRAINALKLRQIDLQLRSLMDELKDKTEHHDLDGQLNTMQEINSLKKQLSRLLGRVVLK
jgi:DNA primase